MPFSLSLDLAASIGTLAVHSDQKLIHETAVSDTFHHSERLIDVLAATLSSLQLELSDAERFITTAGPGSFTGLRIAVASFKAFAVALSRPIETVSSAEARALGWTTANSAHPTKVVRVLTHASGDRYIQSRFRRENGVLRLESEELGTGAEMTAETNELVTLLDERAEERLNGKVGESYLFPSRAQYLALEPMGSRKRYATEAEIVALTPLYYGETKYKELPPKSSV